MGFQGEGRIALCYESACATRTVHCERAIVIGAAGKPEARIFRLQTDLTKPWDR
ncbi:MAG: hypothetical protein ACJAYU_002434 [Bradymonadia bacterium]|jgi:hypothetical protein